MSTPRQSRRWHSSVSLFRDGPDGPYLARLSATIAEIVADQTWRMKAELCVQALYSGRAVRLTSILRAGLNAIRSGDVARLERWLDRWEDAEDARLALNFDPYDGAEA